MTGTSSYIGELLSNIEFPNKIIMVFEHLEFNKIILKPINEQNAHLLDDFRKKVADLIHLKLDNTYEFHISIAYSMELFSEKEKEEAQKFFNELMEKYAINFPPILIDNPIYALYNDMSYFRECNLGRKNLGYFDID